MSLPIGDFACLCWQRRDLTPYALAPTYSTQGGSIAEMTYTHGR